MKHIDLSLNACQHGSMTIRISPLPAYSDNYIWLIEFGDHQAAVVDPGDAAPVLNILQQKELQLEAILVTHNHWDHVNGIETLLQHYSARVFGPRNGQTPGLTHPCQQDDHIQIGSLHLDVLEVPGHTSDHIAFYGNEALFCGDTLFAAGCGRLLGGSARQLYDSLKKIADLPITTQVYCTHEYTLDNLKFAHMVEPGNTDIMQRTQIETEKRRQGTPTLPSTMQLELATNPFLRCHMPEIINSAEQFAGKNISTTAEVFKVLRFWKDGFS